MVMRSPHAYSYLHTLSKHKAKTTTENKSSRHMYTIAEETIIHSFIYQHYFDRDLIKVYSCPTTFSGTLLVFVSSLPV